MRFVYDSEHGEFEGRCRRRGRRKERNAGQNKPEKEWERWRTDCRAATLSLMPCRRALYSAVGGERDAREGRQW